DRGGEALSEVEGVVYAAEQRIGVLAKHVAEEADTVVHFCQDEVFLYGCAASGHGIELERQGFAVVLFRRVLVNLVRANRKRDEADRLAHSKLRKYSILCFRRRLFLN